MRSGSFRVTKHSKEHWLSKVYRPQVRGASVDNYAVRLHHAGIEKRLSLGTPSREAAADLARGMFVFLSANGWAGFLAKYRNPNPVSPLPGEGTHPATPSDRQSITVGEYLARSGLSPSLSIKRPAITKVVCASS